ncbi:unnamed protein product [Schistosoma rodhaini]|uniref:Uncharacterized protein n=1 Tax=Schistosoma rodhaini TaxID=6188 RepID=A0AA85FE56_9TREM|nr:unnamed protein product [Schistosoma rodhaini]CAH8530735.1 unnamed protein product [Schistosoma rodhaini]
MYDNDYLISRIQTIYSNRSNTQQFIQSSYILLNDILYYYNIKSITLNTIHVLGKFLSYIIRIYNTIDYINIKCIEIINYLINNYLIKNQLKNLLIYLLEYDLSLNLLNKQLLINQYTWYCINNYIINNNNNIASLIRILIYIIIYKIIHSIKYNLDLIQLKYLINMISIYKITFNEILLIIKLIKNQLKLFNLKNIKLFCLNIIQLLYWNINYLNNSNDIHYIQYEIYEIFNNYNINNNNDNNNIDNNNYYNNINYNNNNYYDNFNNNNYFYNYNNINNDYNNYNNNNDNNNNINNNNINNNYYYKQISDYGYKNDLNNYNKLKQINLIPNYIYTLLYNKNNYRNQLKGINELQLFTWQLFCNKNSIEFDTNDIDYIKNIKIFLKNILNIMYHQTMDINIHLMNIVLMLLHHLPNYIIEENIKEIFRLFHPILMNPFNGIHQIIHRMLSLLLTCFTADILFNELWLYYNNNHTNDHIRINVLYCIKFILINNQFKQNLDIMKMIQCIVQGLKDQNKMIQSVAIECCAILIMLYNSKSNQSIINLIKNNLIHQMSIIEINFLIKKIKKFIKKEKNFNENLVDMVVGINEKMNLKQNCNRSIHHSDYRSDSVDSSIRRNTSERYDMPIIHLDSNKMNHLNGSSYYQISESRKRLKSCQSDIRKSIRRYSDQMKTHDSSRQTQRQLDHSKDMKCLSHTDKIFNESPPTTINVMPDLPDTFNEEEIICPVNCYNQTTENQINRGLESLRNSVSRRRKQWLFNQLAKLKAKKLSESNHENLQSNLFQMKSDNIENQHYPLCLDSNLWINQDNDKTYRPSSYEYLEKVPKKWRNDISYSLNQNSYKQSKYSINNKIYRSMDDIHLNVNKEQSKMEHTTNKNQEKQMIIPTQKLKYSSSPTLSYKEGIQKNSHIIKKSIHPSKRINKPIGIQEEILKSISSNHWEEQIKATNMIQNLLETMNVKPLEIIFSNSKYINILIHGIEQTIKCLRSHVCLNGLKTIQQLCYYLNAINQGHLLNSYAQIIITTLLSRISEDSSTKFLQNESYKSLEAYISCIDHVIAIHLICTTLWDKFLHSNIRRNTIGQMLTYIICNQLPTKKKNIILLKRLGYNGIKNLMKVVDQLINDKVSSTRLYGRKILEQITMVTDINKIYKQNIFKENSLTLKNLTFRK